MHVLNKSQEKIVAALQRLAALKRQPVSYSELVILTDLGLNVMEAHHRYMLSTWLGEIFENNHNAKEPILCTLVVQKQSGMPGKGYFKMVDQLGRRSAGESDVEVFMRELEALRNYYAPKAA